MNIKEKPFFTQHHLKNEARTYSFSFNENGQVGVSKHDSEGSSSGDSASDDAVFVPMKTSPVLTVWRTLWIERDLTTRTDTVGQLVYAELPPISGIVEQQLQRACIQIKEYPLTNYHESICDSSIMQTSSTLSCRDIPYATNSLWTIHIIGCFTFDNEHRRLGEYRCSSDSICIYSESIQLTLDSWNSNAPDEQHIATTSLPILYQTTVAHEIGHALGLPHTSGLMKANRTMSERLQVEYQSFTVTDLLTIQSHAMPQDPDGTTSSDSID